MLHNFSLQFRVVNSTFKQKKYSIKTQFTFTLFHGRLAGIKLLCPDSCEIQSNQSRDIY